MKIKSHAKKILSLILALAMIAGFTVISYAEDNVYRVSTEDEMEQAVIEVIENGGTIELTDSIHYNTTSRKSMTFWEDTVIDLGGNTLTLYDKTIYNFGAKLTIKNGTIKVVTTHHYAAVCNYMFEECVTYLADDLDIISEASGVFVYGGELHSSADIQAEKEAIYNYYYCGGDGYTNLYVDSGKITSKSDYAVYSEGSSNAYINNAQLSSTGIYGVVCSWSDDKPVDLTINNSSVRAYGTGFDSNHIVSHNKGLYLVGCNVNIKDSVIYSEYGNAMLVFDNNGSGIPCNVTAENSSFVADSPVLNNECAAISTLHGGSDNSTVYFSGCKILAENQPFAFYCPSLKSLTFDDLAGDTVVRAQQGCLEFRRGELNITDSPDNEYSVTFEVTEATELTYTLEGATGGTSATGAALNISQHTPGKGITVNINGGTYIAPYALLEEDIVGNNSLITRASAEDVVVNIYDGKFVGEVANNNSNQLNNEYLNIYAGVFAEEPTGCVIPEGTEFKVILDEEDEDWYVLGDSVYAPEEKEPDQPEQPDQPENTDDGFYCKWCIKYGDKYENDNSFVGFCYRFLHSIIHFFYKIKFKAL